MLLSLGEVCHKTRRSKLARFLTTTWLSANHWTGPLDWLFNSNYMSMLDHKKFLCRVPACTQSLGLEDLSFAEQGTGGELEEW